MSIEKEISDLLAKKKAGTLAEQVGADKVGDGPKVAPGNSAAPGDNADNARNATGSTSYKSKLPKGSNDGKTATSMKPREKKHPNHYSAPGQATQEGAEHEGEGELLDNEPTMDDHIAALMEGETLSEEFKKKAATIFEAAVLQRVKGEVERLEEEYQQLLDEQFEEIAEGLAEQVDGYLDLMVKKWMEDNELALESGMKNEITENFITGLRDLFAESYIEVPEDKVDLVAELETELAELRGQLNESVALNVEMNQALESVVRAEAIAEATVDLTELDAAKFKDLAEELIFEDVETFKEKLEVIRENYFKKKPGTTSLTETPVTDSPVLTEEAKKEPALSGRMAAYAATLNKI